LRSDNNGHERSKVLVGGGNGDRGGLGVAREQGRRRAFIADTSGGGARRTGYSTARHGRSMAGVRRRRAAVGMLMAALGRHGVASAHAPRGSA
jgi:hypothetical protein